jgi:hypothetical protein
VSNAPHIPVHLGAMQSTVRYQMTQLGDNLHKGDVILANHPQAGIHFKFTPRVFMEMGCPALGIWVGFFKQPALPSEAPPQIFYPRAKL